MKNLTITPIVLFSILIALLASFLPVTPVQAGAEVPITPEGDKEFVFNSYLRSK
jgi:hypothetical protein